MTSTPVIGHGGVVPDVAANMDRRSGILAGDGRESEVVKTPTNLRRSEREKKAPAHHQDYWMGSLPENSKTKSVVGSTKSDVAARERMELEIRQLELEESELEAASTAELRRMDAAAAADRVKREERAQMDAAVAAAAAADVVRLRASEKKFALEKRKNAIQLKLARQREEEAREQDLGSQDEEDSPSFLNYHPSGVPGDSERDDGGKGNVPLCTNINKSRFKSNPYGVSSDDDLEKMISARVQEEIDKRKADFADKLERTRRQAAWREDQLKAELENSKMSARGVALGGSGVMNPIQLDMKPLVDAMVDGFSKMGKEGRQENRRHSSRPLPSFSGDPKEWPAFRAMYDTTTASCGFSEEQNWTRLNFAVKGDARNAIKSLLVVPGNATSVINRLEERYGRPDVIIDHLIEEVRKCSVVKDDKMERLGELSAAVETLTATITTLNEPSYLISPLILKEVVAKLPMRLKLDWENYMRILGTTSDLGGFSRWLANQAKGLSLVTTPTFQKTDEKEPSAKTKGKKGERVYAADSSNSKTVNNCCVCSKTDHVIYRCPEFRKLNFPEKKKKVRELRLCYRCLQSGHAISKCEKDWICRVKGCEKKHNTLLHPPATVPAEPDGKKVNDQTQAPAKIVEETSGHVGDPERTSRVLLRVLPVTLYGPKGEISVNALLDEGNTVTMLSANVAVKIGLRGKLDPLKLRWTNGETQTDNGSRRVRMQIGPVKENTRFRFDNVRTVKALNLPAQYVNVKEVLNKYKHMKGLTIRFIAEEKPLLLIGQPHIHLTMAREIKEGDPSEPVASKTPLGWVLHGNTEGKDDQHNLHTCLSHQSDDDIMHNLVKENFALDSVGVMAHPSNRSKEDKQAEKKMEELTTRVGDRWETGLLWRKEPGVDGVPALPPSYDTAYRRLKGVEKRLRKDDQLKEAFAEKFHQYLKKGYAIKLSPTEASVFTPKQWFLPVFPVIQANKPGKMRPVFDAASRSCGKSLNDFLLTGPDLLTSLPGLLINFRVGKIAFVGDIGEMFHQVRIRPSDQPAQRFLWRESEDKEPDVYQLQVMMFGAASSPYCAQYIRNRNALEFESSHPEAVKAIVQRHYMDDYMGTCNNVEDATRVVKDVMEVHSRGGFRMGKWNSNSKEVLQSINPEDRVVEAKDMTFWSEIPTERVLGLNWDPNEDCFFFKLNINRAGEGIASGQEIPTKRDVLRLIMLQIWRDKTGWDDEVTSEVFAKWKSWVQKLPQLEKIRIPRMYSQCLDEGSEVQLHVFADASEQAHCCVAYFRISHPKKDDIQIVLVSAKSRVSPLKPITIPRSELQGSTLAVRLGNFIMTESEIVIKSVTYWIDSKTVIQWIRSEARGFPTFVSNRIGEIQEKSNVSDWRWVPTKLNVADDGTREGKCDLSMANKWWTGPDFLRQNEDFWLEEPEDMRAKDCDLPEIKREMCAAQFDRPKVNSGSEKEFPHLPILNRFSKYLRLVRATAAVIVAGRLFKRKDVPIYPTKQAEKLLYIRSQWEAYPDDMNMLEHGEDLPRSSRLYQLSPILVDGVLRMKSRLAKAEAEDIRHPVILHAKNPLTIMIMEYYHQKFLHQGEDTVRNEMRQHFFIPHLRTAIRGVVQKCRVCIRRRIRAKPPQMGSLPLFRIEKAPRPFTIVGMDYFGPFLVAVKRSQVKRYGVIFTCLNVRAVHLEIADDLTLSSCINAIRRFIARRGQPKIIWSDNGTNLHGADKELKLSLKKLNAAEMNNELAVTGTEWKFIPPASPHFGATWERLVKSVKAALAVSMKTRTPREEVLRTLFCEAEAHINSRPLADVPVDPENPEALTPFHFLIGTSSLAQPPGVFAVKDLYDRKYWKQAQAMTEIFWQRWVKEFVPNLQKRAKWHAKQENAKVGDMVVLMDDSLLTPRGTYPVGIIEAINPGEDGVVRVVDIRLATGKIYKRPMVKVGILGFGIHEGNLNPEGFGEDYVDPSDVMDNTGETAEGRNQPELRGSSRIQKKIGDSSNFRT